MKTEKTLSSLSKGHFKAEAWLVLLTILWSSTFAFTKLGMEEVPSFYLIGIRFLIATVCFLVFYARKLSQLKISQAKGGILLGILLFLGFAFQTLGLEKTTASRSGFITAIAICMVPILVLIIRRQKPRVKSVIGVIVVTMGLVVLTQPFGTEFNQGDLLTFFCAIAWALYIVFMEDITIKYPFLDVLLWQFITVTVGCFVCAGIRGEVLAVPSMKISLVILYLALFCSFFTAYIQTKYQKGTTATRAALIYSMEPVLCAFFAMGVLGEAMTPIEWAGALIILGGVIYAEV